MSIAKIRTMANWDDVRRLALSLPDATEQDLHGGASWRVGGRLFVWERPLRKSDLEALGDRAPSGPILGARVEHLGAKEALIADDPDVFFTTPHFDGNPSVLASALTTLGWALHVEDPERALVADDEAIALIAAGAGDETAGYTLGLACQLRARSGDRNF